MSAERCGYNCLRNPDELISEPDITGTGTTTAYTITAGIALAIVISYYILAFRPELEPFANTDEDRRRNQPIWRSNPVDLYLLLWRHRKERGATQDIPRAWWRSPHHHFALTKCLVMMSDLQLLTGLAIMVSGFTQLRACLSIYHWQRLTHLSWFSCVTHLSCSTFLRENLRKNKIFQLWRIPGMVALVTMLLYVLATTAQYDWTLSGDMGSLGYSPYSPAVCYMHPRYAFASGENGGDRAQRRIFSMVFLTFGMINRVLGLYPAPNHMALKARKHISDAAKFVLMRCYGKGTFGSLAGSLIAILVYRPLLALFLTVRLCLDTLVSKAFEVSWASLGFIWGAFNLWSPVSLSVEPGVKQWTFGQVMAIALLIVPFVSLIEGFQSHKEARLGDTALSQDHDATNPMQSSNDPHPLEDDIVRHRAQTEDIWKRDTPDHDFYSDCFSFTPLVATSLASVNALAIYFILMPFPTIHELPLILLLHIYLCVLIALVACRERPASRKARVSVRIACFTFYLLITSCGIGFYMPFKVRFGVIMEVSGFVVPILGIYLVLAGVDEWRGWKDRRRREGEH